MTRALGAFLLALLAGCGEAPPEESQGPSTRATPALPAEEPERIAPEDLAALGYVDFAEPDPELTETGVLHRDAARSSPGYDLYVAIPLGTAVLIDGNGNEVQRWRDPEAKRWLRPLLLPEGDLVVVGVREEPVPGSRSAAFVKRLSWEGELRWERLLPAHHDVDARDGGGLAVLTTRRRDVPNPNWPHVQDNGVLLLSGEGEALDERSLTEVLQLESELTDLSIEATLQQVPEDDAKAFADVLEQVAAWEEAGGGAPPGAPDADGAATGHSVDLIHANTVQWIADLERPPALARADVLVTMRHLDQVAAFAWDTSEVLWRWGAGELEGPHEASLLPNGHVLVFDNGIRGRGYTRIVEVAIRGPAAGEVVWQWAADDPASFYCRTRGIAQSLPNGNVLVVDSEGALAFEITRGGDEVWRFASPDVDDEDRRAAIRMERYAPAFVERILAGR